MIKTPVSYDESELIYYPQIHDADGDYLFEAIDTDTAKEIVKRINMHDELVSAMRNMFDMLSINCQCNSYSREQLKKYLEAEKLLERCK